MKNASFQNYNSQKLFVHQGTLLYAQLIYIYVLFKLKKNSQNFSRNETVRIFQIIYNTFDYDFTTIKRNSMDRNLNHFSSLLSPLPNQI